MRSSNSPWSAEAPGRSSAIVRRVSPWIGIQRTCTLRKNAMPVGPQYSTEFGNTSMSMNGLQVWPAPNLPELAVGMAQADRRLARIDARAEEFELEGGLEIAETRGRAGLHTEASLPDAGEPVPVRAELVLERGQLGRPHHVEPVRVVLIDLVTHVEHGETVDVHGRARFLVLSDGRRARHTRQERRKDASPLRSEAHDRSLPVTFGH